MTRLSVCLIVRPAPKKKTRRACHKAIGFHSDSVNLLLLLFHFSSPSSLENPSSSPRRPRQIRVPEFILWEPSLGFIPYPGIPDSRRSQDPSLGIPVWDSLGSQTPVDPNSRLGFPWISDLEGFENSKFGQVK